jgi:hypothetical protein
MPPVIAEVSPDPQTIGIGAAYSQQLALVQGTAPVTWALLQGPAGATVSAGGLVSGWNASTAEVGPTTFEVEASNIAGSDSESWLVRVLSRFDFDLDGDVDLSDFACLQACFSGSLYPYPTGCNPQDLDNDGDVDDADFLLFQACLAGANRQPGC